LVPAWLRLSPFARDEGLLRIDAALREPETLAAIDQSENSGAYPEAALARLRDAGLAELFAGERATAPHLTALNVLCARCSGSLAITVGVNALALLPVYASASEAQLEEVRACLRSGAASALLLTELDSGSDLLANRTIAEPGTLGDSGAFRPAGAATHYRLQGEKQLINGGQRHRLLVTLARTGEGGLGGFSLFIIDREGAANMSALPRFATLPAAAADISGVRFAGTIVPAGARLGAEGDGIRLVLTALSMSRGGISGLAAGAATAARELATTYAQTRRLYGAPIAALPPIGEHLRRIEALELAASALSVRQAAAINALGPAAAHFTAAAKYGACALAEAAVDEGRRVLAARALLRGHAYERLVRDVLLYGIFDGTGHLMLDSLARRLQKLAMDDDRPVDTLATIRSFYSQPPRPLVEVTRLPANPACILPLEAHARALAALPGAVSMQPLVAVAATLLRAVRELLDSGRWDTDRALVFEASRVLAKLETLFALAELADPPRRQALGIPRAEIDEAAYRFAIGWLGADACAAVRELAAFAGLDGDLAGAEQAFLHTAAAARVSASLPA
jgi:alkylation response protein AidB-like acyl-CoA dehydrogenase